MEANKQIIYLTIKLRTRDFYEKSRASNLIVLVEAENKHKLLHKNIEKLELQAIFKKKCVRKMITVAINMPKTLTILW